MLTGTPTAGGQPATLSGDNGCDREPIHVPGSIQPHGVLLVLRPTDLVVIQASSNLVDWLGVGLDACLGQPITNWFDERFAQRLRTIGRQSPSQTAAPSVPQQHFLGLVAPREISPCLNARGSAFDAVAHPTAAGLVLELEIAEEPAVAEPTLLLERLMQRAESAATLEQLCQVTAEEVRRLSGFDRVLVYRFDADGNGTVVGEAGNGRLPSYLHHRFPAADIPAQARSLYRHNRLRLIPDADYQPVPLAPQLNPQTGAPLDMSYATLRSVSPIHVQYMKNMQTAASMSVSILRDGQLWGLISCHHQRPRYVSLAIRRTCDLFARAFSLRLSALEHRQDFARGLEVRSAYGQLLETLAGENEVVVALREASQPLLALAGAAGAAVRSDKHQLLLVGQTPTPQQVDDLAAWLATDVQQDLYHTDNLAAAHPPAAAYAGRASGLLAIGISKLHASYVMWFRPEIIQTIKWGGDPSLASKDGDAAQLHPRASFATWKEIVRRRSLPWQASELEVVSELRSAIVDTVLRKAEELAELNTELARSNKELEAFSYSVSHDLRAPLRHIAGFAELLMQSETLPQSERDRRWLENILQSSEYASRLVDKLLSYSRLGQAQLQLTQIDLQQLVEELRQDVLQDAPGRDIRWEIAELPSVTADLMMLRMAVRDLISNAVKYTRHRDVATIEIGSRQQDDETIVWVKDNGVGFDMQYMEKLFGVFQRLHRWEDYEGTGIGLANVRRVIERHGGRTWADGKVDGGATLFFSLPRQAISLPPPAPHSAGAP